MDEQGIQTYCFALTASDGSGPRARMEADAFEFVSVEEVASLELAREINGRQLHVLLDLNGHTKGNRLDVIALQPTPVQVPPLTSRCPHTRSPLAFRCAASTPLHACVGIWGMHLLCLGVWGRCVKTAQG
jgi:hypothetical protein